jgi:capsule assembly protein Wzi
VNESVSTSGTHEAVGARSRRRAGRDDRVDRIAQRKVVYEPPKNLHIAIIVSVVLVGNPTHADPASSYGWWVKPLERAALTVDAVSEDDRPYSTPAHLRDIVGDVALSCEHQEGRPCGDGVGAFGEVDSAAGYEQFVTAATRLRLRTGTDRYGTGFDVDRAHVDGAYGPVSAKVGRDVLVLGPGPRTQLGWGDHAVPLDQVRVDMRLPVVSGTYVLGRLRAPQRYPGDLVSIVRGQLDFGSVQVGGMQLLQLDGSGAPGFSFTDFILEHFTRRDPSASATDSSNRRVGADVAWRIAGFGGATLTYQIMFEDWRKHFADAVRYDADHAFSFANKDVLVEWQKTGVRSQEHSPRVTGFTNAGRTVGSPLGPDAQSFYAGTRRGQIQPWVELVRLSSDTYTFIVDGPILHRTRREAEWRYRVGARTVVPIRPDLAVDAQAWFEHVEHLAFVVGQRRENLGVIAALVWTP